MQELRQTRPPRYQHRLGSHEVPFQQQTPICSLRWRWLGEAHDGLDARDGCALDHLPDWGRGNVWGKEVG